VDSEVIGALPAEPGGMFSAILSCQGKGLFGESRSCESRMFGLGVVLRVRCVAVARPNYFGCGNDLR
jgi:hypothetical protein